MFRDVCRSIPASRFPPPSRQPRRVPFAAISRAPPYLLPSALLANPKASNSLMRSWTGRLPKMAGSPTRSMKTTGCRRSVSPVLSPIRPSWYNPWRWPRSRRPSRAIGPGCRRTSSMMGSSPTPSSKPSSTPARRMRTSSPVRGRSMRPSTSSRPRPTMRRTPCASAEASCSVTAPVPAKAASLPASSSTTGCRGAAKRCGSPNPTSCWRTRNVTGRRSAWNGCWSRRYRVSRRARTSRYRKPSYSPPMPRYGPTIAARSFPASSRSSNGWAPTSME